MSQTIEFGSKQTADRYREEHSEDVCPVDDDRRLKRVAFVSDAPGWLIEQAEVEAASGRSERANSGGQTELTKGEKDRLGPFTGQNNYRLAAAVKGVLLDAGVDDWTAHHDPTLSVDEHRDVAERAAREGGGRRLDAEDSTDDRLGRTEAAMAEGCDLARDLCEDRDPDACEFLQEACDYDADEVARILDEDGADVEEEITGPAAGALGRAWQGYKAGIARLERAIEDALEAKRHAEGAAAAINAIRGDHGQDPITLERLEELSDRPASEGEQAHDAEGHTETILL